MIIDAHAHLSNTDYGNTLLYLKQIQEAGIEKGMAVPGGMVDVRRMTDYITGKSAPDNPVPDNGYVAQACRDHEGVLYGFLCINPHDPDALHAAEQGFQNGYRGLKLSPLTHQFSFAGKAVADLAALCGNYGLPMYTHVVYSPGACTGKFIALARQFPGTHFLLGHMGFGPADSEGLEAAAELDNFYMETSTGSFLHIKEAVKKAGSGKVVFGSEFPLSHPFVELVKILRLDLAEVDTEKILGGNISALTGLPGTWRHEK
ncbi:MAG: amidohydrolase family protein [Bacillota bacterium]